MLHHCLPEEFQENCYGFKKAGLTFFWTSIEKIQLHCEAWWWQHHALGLEGFFFPAATVALYRLEGVAPWRDFTDLPWKERHVRRATLTPPASKHFYKHCCGFVSEERTRRKNGLKYKMHFNFHLPSTHHHRVWGKCFNFTKDVQVCHGPRGQHT